VRIAAILLFCDEDRIAAVLLNSPLLFSTTIQIIFLSSKITSYFHYPHFLLSIPLFFARSKHTLIGFDRNSDRDSDREALLLGFCTFQGRESKRIKGRDIIEYNEYIYSSLFISLRFFRRPPAPQFILQNPKPTEYTSARALCLSISLSVPPLPLAFHGINPAFARLLHLSHHGAPPHPLEAQANTRRRSLCQLRAVSLFSMDSLSMSLSVCLEASDCSLSC
jgi:hypothetical protein